MTMNRILAAILAIVMVLGLAVCGGVPTASAEAEPRTITIGVWWDIYYDSTHESEESDPAYSGSLSDQMRFENVKAVEEKYNVRFEYVNMTYTGVKVHQHFHSGRHPRLRCLPVRAFLWHPRRNERPGH